jgi:hypothetical protein
MGGWNENGSWEVQLGEYGVDSFGSEQGLVAGPCEHDYEPSGSGTTELVSYINIL